MKNEKLTINAIADKIEIEEVEVQSDPCKIKNDYSDQYDCLVDCAGPNGGRSPYMSKQY
ncbi:hypothetical protein QJR30_18140 (plasmid) [Paraclostridium sordellii]|uniref:hypothetical protein n=1 Tax=Paraclostridium sordellii TaxID=1505 RepID=UPI0005E0E786|nr:hypothetical protein [Paeniclostridium sordellii]CEP41209.1 Uncharacterised protein [[Clostridium] sordellii] [Paeniclostridium sordellii]